MFEHEHAGIGKVVNREKFAARLAGPPYGDGWCIGYFSLMHAANKRRRHMAMLRMIVVARPVQVSWHDRDEICAVLVAIGFDELDTGDLCQRIPLIGWL